MKRAGGTTAAAAKRAVSAARPGSKAPPKAGAKPATLRPATRRPAATSTPLAGRPPARPLLPPRKPPGFVDLVFARLPAEVMPDVFAFLSAADTQLVRWAYPQRNLDAVRDFSVYGR